MKQVQALTEDGQTVGMEVQIAAVKKPLASVRRICQAGNKVVFDEQGSYIEHKASGKRARIDQDDQGHA
eukprot:15266590-Alexandrium_andersonii.AAC.1